MLALSQTVTFLQSGDFEETQGESKKQRAEDKNCYFVGIGVDLGEKLFAKMRHSEINDNRCDTKTLDCETDEVRRA